MRNGREFGGHVPADDVDMASSAIMNVMLVLTRRVVRWGLCFMVDRA